MIIQGHPDILRGPQGLNGLHGFGLSPLEPDFGYSPAYKRFMWQNGGPGIEALYQEIRDFINTPGRTQAEIEQAKAASGVSDDDVRNAMYGAGPPAPVYAPPAPVIAPPAQVNSNPYGYSAAYIRFLPENGGAGIQALYQEIRDFINTPGRTQVEIEQAKAASGVSDDDVINAMAVQVPDNKIVDNVFPVEVDCGPNYTWDGEMCRATGLGPITEPDIGSLKNREIVDYVMTHSDAEIRAQMVISNVSQDDIINAFASFDPTMPNGQSPAYTRSLPENGGGGIANYYKEINDFVNTHSFYEVLSQMFRSEVSRADLEAAKAYAFSQSPAGGGSGDVMQPVQPIFEPLCPPGSILVDGVCVGDPTTYGPPILDSSLRNREIVDFVMTHSDAEIRAQMVISNVSQDDIINAFKSFDPTMPNGQSPAYARSLPENGGGGIANFYKEINDFVKTHSFYEVLSQMFRSEVSRADVQAANTYEFFKSPSGGGAKEADALAVAQQAAREAAAAAKREADAVVAREAYLAAMAGLEAAIAAEQAAAVARAAQLAAAEQAAAAMRIAAIEKDQARRNAEQAAAQAAADLRASQQAAASRAAQAEAAARAAQAEAASRAAQEAAASLAAQQAAATRAAQEAAASLAAQQAAAQAAADLRAAQQAAASRAAQAEAAARAAQAEAASRAAQQAAEQAAAESRARQEAAALRAAAAAQASARAAQEVADARARADALAAQAAQAAQQQDAIRAALAAQEAAAAAAAAQKASDQAAAAIAIAQASAAAVTTKTEQSQAYTRFLPENGGQGIDALYQEIRDFVSTHTDAEIKQTAAASGVSNTDIVKAVSQTQQTTATAVASSAAKATAAATAAAASAATAAAIAVAKSPAQSQAYTKFLPENGGKGITALYKEISDFVSVSTPAEIEDAMIKGGISEADVLNALKVFPKKVVETTGVSLPYIAAAAAAALALFVLVKK